MIKNQSTREHIVIALVLFVAALFAFITLGQKNDASPKTIVVTSDAPAPVQYIPIVVTAVPEVDIPGDLWRCIQNPSLSLDAPDWAIDYNNYEVVDLHIKQVGDKGQLNVYLVHNYAREETRSVTTEWGVDTGGLSVLIRCDVPIEWSNHEQLPTQTPYILPSEAPSAGEGVGAPES